MYIFFERVKMGVLDLKALLDSKELRENVEIMVLLEKLDTKDARETLDL